jgi:hypothetical protein
VENIKKNLLCSKKEIGISNVPVCEKKTRKNIMIKRP